MTEVLLLTRCCRYLLARLQGGAGVVGAEVAAQGVPRIIHPVVHCEWASRNDGAGRLVHQPLVLACGVVH